MQLVSHQCWRPAVGTRVVGRACMLVALVSLLSTACAHVAVGDGGRACSHPNGMRHPPAPHLTPAWHACHTSPGPHSRHRASLSGGLHAGWGGAYARMHHPGVVGCRQHATPPPAASQGGQPHHAAGCLAVAHPGADGPCVLCGCGGGWDSLPPQ